MIMYTVKVYRTYEVELESKAKLVYFVLKRSMNTNPSLLCNLAILKGDYPTYYRNLNIYL